MRPDAGTPTRAYWVLAIGMVSISFSPILVRWAADAPGATVALWRTLIAVLVLLPFAARSAVRDWVHMKPQNRGLTLVAGVMLGFHFIAWIESIYHTSVASASILFTTNPLFIAAIGFVVLDERLSRRTVIAIIVSVLGASLIGLGDASDDHFPRATLGNTLALSAAILFAVYLLIGRVTRRSSDWLSYVFPLYTVVALTVVGYALVRGFPIFGFGWEVYVACALMALGPQILGHGSINYAVKFFPAAVLGLLGLVEPVLATLWAWLLFGEIPGILTFIGMTVILIALTYVYWPSKNLFLGNSE